MRKRTVAVMLSLTLILCVVPGLKAMAQDTGFLSSKGADIQLKGELEYELVATESEPDLEGAEESTRGGTGEPNAHLQLDKFVLQPIVKIGDNLKLDAQIYIKESSTQLNEVHAKFSNLKGGNTWLDLGLYERWPNGQYSRVSEGYPLIGTAFWRDDAMTITLGGEHGAMYWMLSAGNGYEIDSKQVAEDGGDIQDMIHDNHSTGDFDEPEWGLNLGVKSELENGANVDVTAFYYVDKLSDADISTLADYLGGYTSTDDSKRRIGVGINYQAAGWKLTGQFITAEDGDLDRDGYAVEISKSLKFEGREWFTGFTPVVSYGEVDIDDAYGSDPMKPQSWDRQKTILAVILDVHKNIKIKTEYYINGEDTGDAAVDNDELLVQLEIKL